MFVITIVDTLQKPQSPLHSECRVDSASPQQCTVTNDNDDIDELLQKILHLDSKYVLHLV